MFFYPASAIRHPENNTSTPLLARVSERVQLFSRLLTRSLLYEKLNYLFSSARNDADPDPLIEIIRESKLLITY
jgi:hypothetical protein